MVPTCAKFFDRLILSQLASRRPIEHADAAHDPLYSASDDLRALRRWSLRGASLRSTVTVTCCASV
jgi:hypothetical protein